MEEIRQEAQYGGLRVRIRGNLGQARLHLQVDIGFGDVITPEREEQDYPTLLDLPVPRIWTYPRETLIAEKLEAMVDLGATNTRVKDLWDIACLARGFAFDGETLRTAIAETLGRRTDSARGHETTCSAPGLLRGHRAWGTLGSAAAADRDGRRRSGSACGRG